MNHPVALVLITRVQIVIAHIKKLLDVLGEFVKERIAMPHFIEYDESEFVGARWWHVRFWSKQWTYNVIVNDVDLISDQKNFHFHSPNLVPFANF